MKEIAVVILNWNGEKLLKQFLPAIIKNTPPDLADIYIIDNASTDNSVEYVKENFPTIKTIMLDKNYGFAGGYNLGLKQIQAKYYAIINSDIEVTENWLSPLYNMLEHNTNIAMVQPKIKAYNNKEYFEYAGAAGGFLDKNYYPFCRGRIGDYTEKDEGQYDTAIEIFWASGATSLIRSNVFWEIGGFDEHFFAHMEEIDLCWRIKSRGYKIYNEPSSVVYHIGGASLDKSSPKKTFLNFRNNILLIYKNKKNFFPFIIKRLILDTALAFLFLFKLKIRHFFAVTRAHCQSYIYMIKLRHARKENMQKTKIWTFNEIYPGNILWEAGIKKKEKFKDLNWK